MQFDVFATITALGIEPISQTGAEIIARCPQHNDTGRPNWSINVTSGLHHCWSCGYGGSLVRLVGDTKGLHLTDAKAWARSFRSEDRSVASALERDVMKPKATKQFVISEADLAIFKTPPAWALEARHLTLPAAEAFGVKWQPSADAWITPIRDPWTHFLRGWQVKGERDRMFRNYPAGVDKHTTLFGLQCYKGHVAVLVESPLDAVRLLSAGVHGGLATYGASISDEQIDLLAGYADSVVIAMDNPSTDKAGEAATRKLVTALSRRMPTRVLDYDHTNAKDVGDMTDREILAAVANARSATRGQRVVH